MPWEFITFRHAAIPQGRPTPALTCCRSWVGTRRVACGYVSSSPRLAPDLRLSPHPAQHLWAISMGDHEASVSISAASTGLHPCLIPCRRHPREKNSRGQLTRSLGTLFADYSWYSVLAQARGLRHGDDSPCRRLSRPQTTTPPPPLPEALGFRWGLPSLLPTPLGILQEASRVRPGRLRQNDGGGVLLAAPSALCGSPVCRQGRTG
jgi:hypothetical protein